MGFYYQEERDKEYAQNFNVFDKLNESQSEFTAKQLNLFN